MQKRGPAVAGPLCSCRAVGLSPPSRYPRGLSLALVSALGTNVAFLFKYRGPWVKRLATSIWHMLTKNEAFNAAAPGGATFRLAA
jgi:hypothetical protein